MKKISFLLLLITVSVLSFGQDVKVSHNLPESVAAGQSFDMDVTLTKGNIGSFAKFQSDLPPGFTATSVDSKGGNFTFENQRLKIVWVAVPSDPTFTFKIRITVPADAPALSPITAKFFYLENNIKKEYEIPTHNLKVTSSGTASTPTNTVSTVSTPTNTESTAKTEPVTTNTVAPTNTEPVTTNTESASTNTATTSDPSTTPSNVVKVPSSEPVTTNTATTENKTTTTTVAKTEPPKTTPSTSENKSSTTAKSGVVYKVQIGAFTNSPDRSKFSGLNVSVKEENGMYKALSGNFSTEAEATKHRDDLAAKGYPGFVVVYENGVRTRFIR